MVLNSDSELSSLLQAQPSSAISGASVSSRVYISCGTYISGCANGISRCDWIHCGNLTARP